MKCKEYIILSVCNHCCVCTRHEHAITWQAFRYYVTV